MNCEDTDMIQGLLEEASLLNDPKLRNDLAIDFVNLATLFLNGDSSVLNSKDEIIIKAKSIIADDPSKDMRFFGQCILNFILGESIKQGGELTEDERKFIDDNKDHSSKPFVEKLKDVNPQTMGWVNVIRNM